MCVASHVVDVWPVSDGSRVFFFLMIRRPPRSTLDRSSAASDVYKRQAWGGMQGTLLPPIRWPSVFFDLRLMAFVLEYLVPVSYTHLRAHETVLDLVCRLLLEKKN